MVEFRNPRQIINMGGPWVADAYWEGLLVEKDVLVDNYIVNNNRLFFIRYHGLDKWARNNFFTICYLDIPSRHMVEIPREFDEVYLVEVLSENEVGISRAFHSGGMYERIRW